LFGWPVWTVPGASEMIGRWRRQWYRQTNGVGPTYLAAELTLFTGWGDARLGLCVDRHPSEWSLTLAVPFVQLCFWRVR
jgi:hypothetical protein